jgi:hypothetical protein
MATVYEAGRNRVDTMTLEQLNRPAADLHARNVCMEMQSTILSGKAAELYKPPIGRPRWRRHAALPTPSPQSRLLLDRNLSPRCLTTHRSSLKPQRSG